MHLDISIDGDKHKNNPVPPLRFFLKPKGQLKCFNFPLKGDPISKPLLQGYPGFYLDPPWCSLGCWFCLGPGASSCNILLSGALWGSVGTVLC